jgi:hypothetical protein
MGVPLLDVSEPPCFYGRIVSVDRDSESKTFHRSYDHQDNGYGWIPFSHCGSWGFDAERIQGRAYFPLMPNLSERSFLCGWTRAESIAKLMSTSIILIWKRYASVLSMDVGIQALRISGMDISTLTWAWGEVIFSLSRQINPPDIEDTEWK